jgi:hypothetical protein
MKAKPDSKVPARVNQLLVPYGITALSVVNIKSEYIQKKPSACELALAAIGLGLLETLDLMSPAESPHRGGS